MSFDSPPQLKAEFKLSIHTKWFKIAGLYPNLGKNSKFAQGNGALT